LEARGFEPEVINEVVERLEEAGGLDDERYARLFAEDKRALEGWGEERIRASLEARSVAASLIDAALADVTHAGELSRALELLERRGEAVAGEAARGRAYGFLIRRGYPSEVAYDAVRRAEAPAG
jgi:regulatory protein